MPNRPTNSDGLTAPLWVGLTTYLICWGLGGYLLVAESRATEGADKGLLAVGVLLILFPALSFQGLGKELIKAISKRVGGE